MARSDILLCWRCGEDSGVRWGEIGLFALLLTGCHRATEKDVQNAKRMAAMTKPSISWCGGRFLTEAELQKMVPGATEIAHYGAYARYGYDGIVRNISGDFERKYVIVDGGICEIQLSGLSHGCNFYIERDSLIFYLGVNPRPIVGPLRNQDAGTFCRRVQFKRGQ
jgi:hypothetical protein